MNDPRWVWSTLDRAAHLICDGDRPPGVVKARCGHLLPAIVTPTAPGRTCPICEEILRADHLRGAIHAWIAALAGAYAHTREPLGHVRRTLGQVVALANEAPDLTDTQLRDRLQDLADRTPPDG